MVSPHTSDLLLVYLLGKNNSSIEEETKKTGWTWLEDDADSVDRSILVYKEHGPTTTAMSLVGEFGETNETFGKKVMTSRMEN